MRIMIVTQIYPGYEAETQRTSPYAIHYFAKEWKKMGYDVEVIRLWPYRTLPFSLFMDKKNLNFAHKQTFKLDSITIHRAPIVKIPGIDFINFNINQTFHKLKENIKNFNPDVIISHAISPSYYLSQKISELQQIPMFLVIHKTDIKHLKNKNSLIKFKESKNKNLKGIFYRSSVLKKQFNDAMNNQYKDNVIISSGIKEEEILNRNLFMKKVDRKPINLIVACNLIPLKNVDIIIKAIYILINKFPKINLKIIGDGPERGKLEKMVREKQLEENIKFLGYLKRSSVLDHMLHSDLFVMVSSPETFGLVYLEAMAKGCMVIGSKGEGIDGIINDGKNGYLCEVNNIKELVHIIENYLFMDYKERKKIYKEMFETIKNMTNEKMAKYYLNNIKDRL